MNHYNVKKIYRFVEVEDEKDVFENSEKELEGVDIKS
jgi:hypothetical protein